MRPHLVFLPGASGNTTFWQPLIAQLHYDYQIQVIAYPGFANQPLHSHVNNFADLSAYVLAQIPVNAIIIAQSMGGIFAIQAALTTEKQVQKLVLMATSGGVNLSTFKLQDWRADYHAQFPHYPQWFSQVQLDYSAQLQSIKIPTLLLWGDQDGISPIAVGQHLQAHLSHAKLHIIKNGDHHFAHQYAQQVGQYLIPFLQENHHGSA